MKYSTFFALIAAVVVTSCRKDLSGDGPDLVMPGTPNHHIPMGATVTTTVVGQVLDEAGDPVAGALVQAGYGNEATTTDARGAFILAGIRAYQNMGTIRVSKAGYFPGSRSFLPVPGNNAVRITLLTRVLVSSINSVDGGIVSGEGTEITLPANGFMRFGAPYQGDVRVYMNSIDASNAGMFDQMPGALVGAMDGDARFLVSYGMLAVELADAAGNKVELAPGSEAQVRFPVAPSQTGTAPFSIDLWHYDEALGYWVHQGTANRDGDEYVAQVGHFSTWNFDIPDSGTNVQGQLLDDWGNGIHGARVHFSNASGGAVFMTSTTGHFGGMVLGNAILDLEVEVLCAAQEWVVIHTTTVGPFTEATSMAPIALTVPGATNVLGTVMRCDGSVATDAYAFVNGAPFFCDQGQFSFTTCAGSCTVFAVEPGTGALGATTTYTIAGPTQQLGVLLACALDVSTGAVTDIDGNAYTTVVVAGQEWMAENLKTAHYANGDAIPNVTGNTQWMATSAGAWCYYADDPVHDATYGRLYNWYTTADERNACPAGWHVPTRAEWELLITLVGGLEIGGGMLKQAGTTVTGGLWNPPNDGGMDLIGFTALPAGARYVNVSAQMGNLTNFWSQDEYDLDFGLYAGMMADSSIAVVGQHGKSVGMSIRCKRD